MVKRLLLFCLLLGNLAFAQDDIYGSIEWDADLIEIGRPTPLVMEITHPEDLVVIFPDSARDFSPYEVAYEKYFPTKTTDGISIDSKIYYVRTFEIDSVQKIQLPFYFVRGTDTLTRLSNTDSLELDARVAVLSDTLQFKYHEGLTYVEDPPNYFMWVMIGGAILIILIFIAYLLYPVVQRKIKTWSLDREWEKVSKRLNSTREQLSQQEVFITELNSIWRKYLDRDRKSALRSLTSTELKDALDKLDAMEGSDKEVLNETSLLMDRIVFAGMPMEDARLSALVEEVREILEKEYLRRKEGLKS